jgi:uncharacterized protein DUF4038/uncharacterized protein DUF5060
MILRFLPAILIALTVAAAEPVHVWEKQEITLTARGSYENPYTQVDVWIDLRGPGFAKRVYGFWTGEQEFKVRFLATAPGEWTWATGSEPRDAGLAGRSGSFSALPWTETEKQEVSTRRGFIRPTPNRHAFEYADGEPMLYLADTWWAVPTFRYKWYDDDEVRPAGPEMGFKDMVRVRKTQGFNGVAMLASMPNWAADGHPSTIQLDDAEKTTVRNAWGKPGTKTAKDMHNEGGRPFHFPGKVPGYEDVFPDVDRINPAYFAHMDKKIDYLNKQGFIPFIEVSRRDSGMPWKKFYEWPVSYARYIQYVFARYQANNCLFSPIHYDWSGHTISGRDYNDAANLVIDRWGRPPFGTLLSGNANPSTLVNFGGADEARWLTFHQSGNRREHEFYWHLTEMFRAKPTLPALHGEPYYSGLVLGKQIGAKGGTDLDSLYSRSGLYGSFLSGGLAGYIYGVQGMWGADIHPQAEHRMWEVLDWPSAQQVHHLRTFAFSDGARFQALEPIADLLLPHQAGPVHGYTGWAYCARTPEQDLFLIFFERDAPQAQLRGGKAEATYDARWFDPRDGLWGEAFELKTDKSGYVSLPARPTTNDWGLKLVLR